MHGSAAVLLLWRSLPRNPGPYTPRPQPQAFIDGIKADSDAVKNNPHTHAPGTPKPQTSKPPHTPIMPQLQTPNPQSQAIKADSDAVKNNVNNTVAGPEQIEWVRQETLDAKDKGGSRVSGLWVFKDKGGWVGRCAWVDGRAGGVRRRCAMHAVAVGMTMLFVIVIVVITLITLITLIIITTGTTGPASSPA